MADRIEQKLRQMIHNELIDLTLELYEAVKEAAFWVRFDRKKLGIKGPDSLLTQLNKALTKAGGK